MKIVIPDTGTPLICMEGTSVFSVGVSSDHLCDRTREGHETVLNH